MNTTVEFKQSEKKTGIGVQVVTMSDVEATEIEWIWQDHIPRGKLSILVGDPGVGKSMLSCAIASIVSTGTAWPVNGAPCTQGDIVMLCGEDDISDTVKPRLEAAEANCDRIHAITMVHDLSADGGIDERLFSLRHDLKELEQVLDSLENPQIVTIDPVNNYLGPDIDIYKDTEVRAILGPLKELAERKNVAIVLFGHMNKNANAKAMYRMIGSIGFIGIARMSFLVTKDPDNPERRLILPIKANITKDNSGLAYTISTTQEGRPLLLWEPEPVTESADEILNEQSTGGGGALTDAIEWLESELMASDEGWILQTDIQTRSKAEGHSMATVRRAKVKLNVVSRKLKKEDSFKHAGQWIWVLPVADKTAEGAQGAQGAQGYRGVNHEHVAEKGQVAQVPTSENVEHVGHVEHVPTTQGAQHSNPYPPELLAAASKAVSGLPITAGYFISQLDPEDYPDIINNPAAARSTAVSMASRR